MSLPDLLLKDSLFRVPPESAVSPRQSLRSKLSGPLSNPLLEGKDSEDTSMAPADGMTIDHPLASEPSPATGDATSANAAGSFVAASFPDRKVASSGAPAEGASEAAPRTLPHDSERRLVIPDALRVRLESLYNASQLAALEDSLKVEGVTLIQGPPGTGKTSTIVGVVSVILHAQLQGQGLPQSASRSVRPRSMQSVLRSGGHA